jgi:hypothetical protein
VADETATSLRRQVDVVQGHDLKASFLTATAAALLAGLVASGHWPANPHAQDMLGSAVIVLVVSLLASVFVWWPRTVGSDADPTAIAGRWHDYEENVLRTLTEHRQAVYKTNSVVLRQKTWGLRIGAATLAVAIIAGGTGFAIQYL